MDHEEGVHNSVICADKTFFRSDSEYPVVVLSVSSSGRVVGILDGNTIEVLQNNCDERIRLNGINCPNYSHVAPQNGLALNRTTEPAGHCFQWNIWLHGDMAAWRLRTVHR